MGWGSRRGRRLVEPPGLPLVEPFVREIAALMRMTYRGPRSPADRLPLAQRTQVELIPHHPESKSEGNGVYESILRKAERAEREYAHGKVAEAICVIEGMQTELRSEFPRVLFFYPHLAYAALLAEVGEKSKASAVVEALVNRRPIDG